jgi:hypothetical protein
MGDDHYARAYSYAISGEKFFFATPLFFVLNCGEIASEQGVNAPCRAGQNPNY